MTTSAEIKVIYEDGDILAINKPPGLLVHATAQSDGPTLVDWLKDKYPALAGVGEPMKLPDGRTIERPGIVHRLDRDTSGVLVVAKNQTAYEWLKRQFRTGQVKKTYQALVVGQLVLSPGQTGRIDAPIGRSRKYPSRRVANPYATGKLRPATTLYKVLANFPNFTYVEAYPQTGRTHQLRAHFKAINFPIACDRVYGTGDKCPAGLARQALHARALELLLPNDSRIKLEADLPADFGQALAGLGA